MTINDSGATESGANCGWARAQLSLMLYGELSFDEEEKLESHLDICAECRAAMERETALHAALDQVAVEPPASLLNQCRDDLWARINHEPVPPHVTPRLGWWDRMVDLLTFRTEAHPSEMKWLRPAGAFALLAVGFLGARLTPGLLPMSGGLGTMNLTNPAAARVLRVTPSSAGEVQIVLDETHQRTVSGRLDDQIIRALLLNAARDPSDPGLRTETLGILNGMTVNSASQASDVRDTLVYALQHDQNAGVRLKAMEGLKSLTREPDVRAALAQALLTDENPGVRTQAIDFLTQGPGEAVDRNIVGTLQELMMREDNAYVRDRCRLVLESLKASSETY